MSTLLMLAAIAIVPGDATAAEPPLTAGQIVKKSDAAYAAVQTYVGTTTVRGEADFGARQLESVSSAKVHFVRPGKVRIEGTTSKSNAAPHAGQPFAVVSDGKTTWKAMAIMNNGAFSKIADIPMAGLAGVAQGAAEAIPAALMKSDGERTGGHDPFVVAFSAPPQLAGKEQVDGADCYKLFSDSDLLGEVTWWIDCETFLLRQMRKETNEAQLARQAKAAAEAMQKIGRQPPPNLAAIKSNRLTFSFRIEQVDGPVDDNLFQEPTKNLERIR